MPFTNTQVFSFNKATIDTINEVGGVYGLARPNGVPNMYTILYVGKTNNLRERLSFHLNNPPVAGITHFFAEAISGDAARTQREYVLIQEFKPVGNTHLK
jgi:excinuclease UvrABC nuclease subunit